MTTGWKMHVRSLPRPHDYVDGSMALKSALVPKEPALLMFRHHCHHFH